MNRILITAIAALAVPVLGNAEPMEYALDLNHSRIWFDVNHQGYSVMRGMFRNFDGTFMYDADDAAASSVNITMDATSVDMFHDGLNAHLQRDDFFGAETNPEVTFSSTSIEDLGGDMLRVSGNLTMLGQSNPVTFEAKHNQTGDTRDGGTKVGFSATGNVDRSDYGMNFGIPNIGSDVTFTLQVEATRAGE